MLLLDCNIFVQYDGYNYLSRQTHQPKPELIVRRDMLLSTVEWAAQRKTCATGI